MRSGAFKATGIELETFRDWRLIVGLVGFVQFFVLDALATPGLITPNLFVSLEGVSLLITVLSIPLLYYLRRGTKVGEFTVEWRDETDTQGPLVISYTGPRGRRRTNLLVEKVKTRPKEPLWEPGYSKYAPVEAVIGTTASLVIVFKNMKKISLGLGFRDSEEMNKIYEQLRGMSSPTVLRGQDEEHDGLPTVMTDRPKLKIRKRGWLLIIFIIFFGIVATVNLVLLLLQITGGR